MGAEGWSYFVPYRENIAEALEDLKQQEFDAGRYHKRYGFSGTHASIQEALAASDADGTRSILDMESVADTPRAPDRDVDDGDDPFDDDEDLMLGQLAPMTSRQLISLFGTDRPTREMIEANDDYYNFLDRGMGLYIIVYDGEQPAELFFAGYSYD